MFILLRSHANSQHFYTIWFIVFKSYANSQHFYKIWYILFKSDANSQYFHRTWLYFVFRLFASFKGNNNQEWFLLEDRSSILPPKSAGFELWKNVKYFPHNKAYFQTSLDALQGFFQILKWKQVQVLTLWKIFVSSKFAFILIALCFEAKIWDFVCEGDFCAKIGCFEWRNESCGFE